MEPIRFLNKYILILVLSLTRSTQAGLSIKLFFLRYWAKAPINYWADKSLTVKNVCFDYPSIYGKLILGIIFIYKLNILFDLKIDI